MEPTRLPTPSNLLEIIAPIIKKDMQTSKSIRPIRTYSQAYLDGKKGFKEYTRQSRKRGREVSESDLSPSEGQPPYAGPSHMITGIQITTIKHNVQPSTSSPPSLILADWTNVVKTDMEIMKNLKHSLGHSDAYLFYVSPEIRRMINAQKIHSPVKSLKESVVKIMGQNSQQIAEAVDNDEILKESLKHTLAKRIKNQASNNPDCCDSLKENIHAVFK